MPTIPLGLKAYERQASFQPEVELVNLFIEKDDSGASPDQVCRIMRPGLADRSQIGDGPIRGMFRQDNFLAGAEFVISGGTLYKNGTALGSIAGSGLTPFAPSIDRLFILGGSTIYHTDGASLGTVALPDDAEGVAVDIDTLNSYVLVSCSDGTVYWIVPGEITIDPLDFVTAESSPDGLIAGRRIESEIFFMGQSSTEPWQLTGDFNAPFQKAVGRQYDRGARSRDTVRRFDNSLLWVGDNGNVYRAGTQPQVVSDEALAERIRKATGPLSAMVFGFDRHEVYALRIPGQGTFVYDASMPAWSRYTSAGEDEWEPQVAIYDNQGVSFGSAVDGQTWDMAPDSAYDGTDPIEWKVTGTVAVMGRPARNDSMAVSVGCGDDCTVRLRWRDAREDFPDYYEELDVRAPADVATMYRMGSISPPFRTFELSGNDGVRIRISGAATEAWQ